MTLTPKTFFRIGGIVLTVIGIAGLAGLLGTLSQLVFFRPPYWINWAHFILGVSIFLISFTHYHRLQKWLVLFPAIVATTMGLMGILFGSYLATLYNIPDLAVDSSDHVAHLIVGLLAIWAWKNRTLQSPV